VCGLSRHFVFPRTGLATVPRTGCNRT
jgi:hypothetical protein